MYLGRYSLIIRSMLIEILSNIIKRNLCMSQNGASDILVEVEATYNSDVYR